MKRFKRYFCFILVTCIVFTNFVLCRNTHTLVSANEGTQLDPKVTIISHELVGTFLKDQVGSATVSPEKSYDGDANTAWGPDCGGYNGTGIIFTLNGTYDISSMRITTPYALGKVTFYKVAVSNDKTAWTDIITVNDASHYADGDGECTFSNLNVKEAKYVRVMLTGRQDGGTWPGLKEVEIFGTISTIKVPETGDTNVFAYVLVLVLACGIFINLARRTKLCGSR